MKATQEQIQALADANVILAKAGMPMVGEIIEKTVAAAIANQVLEIIVRSNYGAPAMYPANYEARIIAAIAGTKTLSFGVLVQAKKLGYQIKQVEDPSAKMIHVPGLSSLLVGAAA